jgi:hypothetical protein
MTTALSKPMAEGRTAEIHPWEDGYILKFYRDWYPADWVECEARLARAAYAAGIPARLNENSLPEREALLKITHEGI